MELKDKSAVSVAELEQLLSDYAKSGLAISAEIVNDIIDRIKLIDEDIHKLHAIALEGARVQNQFEQTREAEEWGKVQDHLELQLAIEEASPKTASLN